MVQKKSEAILCLLFNKTNFQIYPLFTAASTPIRKKKNLSYDRLLATDVDIVPEEKIFVHKMSQSDVPWIVPQRPKSLNLPQTDRALKANAKCLNFTSVPIVVFDQVIIALKGKFKKNVQIEVRFSIFNFSNFYRKHSITIT